MFTLSPRPCFTCSISVPTPNYSHRHIRCFFMTSQNSGLLLELNFLVSTNHGSLLAEVAMWFPILQNRSWIHQHQREEQGKNPRSSNKWALGTKPQSSVNTPTFKRLLTLCLILLGEGISGNAQGLHSWQYSIYQNGSMLGPGHVILLVSVVLRGSWRLYLRPCSPLNYFPSPHLFCFLFFYFFGSTKEHF